MPSERVQRQIDRLLDEAEEASADKNWDVVRDRCQHVLTFDPGNEDAGALLAAAERGLSTSHASPRPDLSPRPSPTRGEVTEDEGAIPTTAAGVYHTQEEGDPSLSLAGKAPSTTLGARKGSQEGQSEGETKAATNALAAPSAPKPLPTSFVNGRYTVKQFLGEGGKKQVYLAHDSMLDRDVAFALIKTDGLDETGRERIQREAQAMGRLGSHPHIVSVYDIGEEQSRPFIVTELMAGGDIEGLIEKAPDNRLSLERGLEIAQAVCRGLEFAHGQGIVHRDLKPGNVWLTADGVAKIGDFGLAVSLDRSRLTQQGMMVGTVSYMPPEQAMGGEVTPRSDLYSLGAMLYELVTGRPPFVGDESVAIITQHLNVPPVAPTWHNPACPPALETLILHLLEKDPSKRPASAAEVREALGHINLSSQPPPLGGEGETDAAAVSLSSGSSPRHGERPGERSPDNPTYRRTFVGREQELAQLRAAFDAAVSGRGALVMVMGEPGIGKTTLCEELSTYVAVRGGKALVGHCYEEGSLSLPYLPFIEALRSYVLQRELAALKQELGSGAADVARIISEIRDRLPEFGSVGARHASPDAPVSGDPEEERYRLLQGVSGFLRNAANVQPLLVILEDLHDADRGTLDLLLHLARNLQGTRLLIVGSYRDIEVDRAHPLSAALAELRRGASFSRVLLRGLTADEVQRMLSNLAGQDVPWRLAEAVHRQTEGNPLFIQEVLRYLVEEGLITREDGRWQRATDTPLEMGIPEGLRDVIGRRLARLSPECNRLLAIATVIGRDFTLATLQAVAGMGEAAVVEALEEARRVAVLTEQARVGAVQYRFAHAFFRQTLYEELGAARRLRLHQEVARVLEQQYGARLEEHAAELAEHFTQSTDSADLAKAIHYSELAAQRAMAVYAYGEAARHLEQALEVQEVLDPEETTKQCDLLLALGEALNEGGEPHRALDSVAPRALILAEALGDQVRAAQVCHEAFWALRNEGASPAYGTPEAAEWARRAGRWAQPGTLSQVWADLFLGRVRCETGELASGVPILTRVLDLARRLGDAEALWETGWAWLFYAQAPQHAEKRARLAEEMEVWPRAGVRPNTVDSALRQQALVFLERGNRERTEAIWRECELLAERTGQGNVRLRAMQLAATRATLDGRLEEAIAIGEEIAVQGETLGLETVARSARNIGTSRALLYLGRPDEALALRFSRLNGTLCLAAAGRVEEARALLDELVVGRPGAGSAEDESIASGHYLLLEAAVLVGHVQAADILMQRLASSPLVVSGGNQAFQASAARLLGAASAMLGERVRARAYYEQALKFCEKVRFRPEAALTHLQLAELMLEEADSGQQSAVSAPHDGPGESRSVGARHASPLQSRGEALQHLDFAIAEFRAMKMQPALERALRHKELLKA